MALGLWHAGGEMSDYYYWRRITSVNVSGRGKLVIGGPWPSFNQGLIQDFDRYVFLTATSVIAVHTCNEKAIVKFYFYH